MFQFHEGPIKTLFCALVAYYQRSFNSMKVRLKQSCSLKIMMCIWFQFHEGPIKTCWFIRFQDDNQSFQFHEGPIKTDWNAEYISPETRFNSMKVRLKLSPITIFFSIILCFNSMKVRLKRGGKFDFVVREQFQFHEGPIKTLTPLVQVYPLYVSIPWRSD